MEWYRSKKGWTATVLAFLALITEYVFQPWEWAHAAISIYDTIRDHWHYVRPCVALALFLLALFFFERDRRKVRSYDLGTLKGRTLRLRADIQDFLDKAPPPAGERFESENQVGFLRRSARASANRVSKLVHGYELNFAERVFRTYHEYGEAGWSDSELNEVMLAPLKNEKCYRTIIGALGRLAEQSELMEADPNLSWTDVANMTTADREKLIAKARMEQR